MLIWLCTGISIHGIATGDLTVNLENLDCELRLLLFFFLACLDKQQGRRVPKEILVYLSSQLPV